MNLTINIIKVSGMQILPGIGLSQGKIEFVADPEIPSHELLDALRELFESEPIAKCSVCGRPTLRNAFCKFDGVRVESI